MPSLIEKKRPVYAIPTLRGRTWVFLQTHAMMVGDFFTVVKADFWFLSAADVRDAGAKRERG